MRKVSDREIVEYLERHIDHAQEAEGSKLAWEIVVFSPSPFGSIMVWNHRTCCFYNGFDLRSAVSKAIVAEKKAKGKK